MLADFVNKVRPNTVSVSPETERQTPLIEPKVIEPTVKDVVGIQKGEDYHIEFGKRRYRIRSLHKNHTLETLKINLRLWHDNLFYVDDLNLYSAKLRKQYVEHAAEETNLEPDIVKRDVGKILLKLEEIQAHRIEEQNKEPEPYKMPEDEREAALELLRDPNLLTRVVTDFDACGVIGEKTNKLVGYLATVSRKLDKPLAVLIQSTSAAGKSTLMESILSFLPDDDLIKFSAMTGQSLYYLGKNALSHKVLAIAEEEGAERASYSLKLLQSEGELAIATPSKDTKTGRLSTEGFTVKGPVMIFFTSTSIDIDEELKNRCLILTVDEGRKQTKAIHNAQRIGETFEGIDQRTERKRLLTLHQNAQRLLRPIQVINPYAKELTFRSDSTRFRRDHGKYLALIKTVTLLHQYQRPIVTRDGKEYIEVTPDDIKIANKIAHEIFGQTVDDLPPQTRKFLTVLNEMVTNACTEGEIDRTNFRFTQKQIREYSGWGNTQVKVHMKRLLEHEHIIKYRQDRFVSYELIYDGCKDETPQMAGLTDIKSELVGVRSA